MILKSTHALEMVMDAAVVATAPDYVVSYVDHVASPPAATPDAGAGTLNGTTPVTVLAAPSSGTLRQIVSASVCNMDDQIHYVTVRVDVSGTDRYVKRFELMPYDSLHYDGREWFVVDYNGSRKFDDRLGGVSSLLAFAHVSGGAGLGANYVAGVVNGTGLGTVALAANNLFAAPFVAPPRSAMIDRLAVYVTTGVASSTVRLGIYDATSESNLYPNNLLWDSGALATATTNAIAGGTPNLTLTPGRLYWAALNSSSNPTVRAVAVGGACPIFGIADALSATALQICLSGTRTYAALPSTFTASIAAGATAFPAFFLRFSA